jgi:hypothetical protein
MDASVPEVKTYATQPGHGALTLTLLNKGSESSVLTLNIKGGMDGKKATVIRLTAPSVDAKTGVTLGGAEVTAAGTWRPAKPEMVQVRKGQLSIDLPAASAAVVQIA